jgi:His/Glu/Gln/Arg/opine family amino acid ABC transporter permease subunit
MRQKVMRKVPPPVRFVAIVVLLVLVFGACGSLTLGALDKVQTRTTGSLLDPGVLLSGVWHFLQTTVQILTTATTPTGVPLRNFFLSGLALTIEFCAISMPLAIVLGLVLALMSRARNRWLRLPARSYVEFFRNTPLFVQMLAIYWGLTFLPHTLLNPFTAGIATLVLNYAAYECENLRAGLAAVDRGQGEAAESLGMGFFQSLRFVVLPQTISVVLPPVLNDLIYMFKDSSLLSVITIIELTAQTTGLGRRFPTYYWQFILIGGLIYLALSLPLARFARGIEERLRSTTYVPRTDPIVAAMQVLIASTLIGLLAGILAVGFSFGAIFGALGQWIAAVGLILLIMLFVLIVLGGIITLPGGVRDLFKRPDTPDQMVNPPVAVGAE